MIKSNYSSQKMFFHFCLLPITGTIGTLTITISFIILGQVEMTLLDRAFFALHAFGLGYFVWALAHAVEDYKTYTRRSRT
jgi:hypothetical protein